MTNKILDLNGAPAHVATDAKKAHDPDELQRERIRLTNLLQQHCQAFVKDLQDLPNSPTIVQVDRERIIAHHDAQWRKLAQAMNAGSFPHPVDEDAFKKEVDLMLGDEERQRDLETPLAQLGQEGLAKYDLLLVGSSTAGDLYINNRVAVMVSPHGPTAVWLRTSRENGDEWCSGWWRNRRGPVYEGVNYKLGELFNLLAALRVSAVTRLTDAQMDLCRTPTNKGLFR